MKLKHKYWINLVDLKKSGYKNKLLFLFLIGETVFFLIFYDFSKTISENFLSNTAVLLLIACLIFATPFFLIVLFTKSINLTNHQQYLTYRYHFKTDVINSLRLICPEIRGYIFNQKLHPHYFIDCGMFGKSYLDYRGDDWLKCEYSGVNYELCELEVTKLFRKGFHGIFIVGFFPEGVNQNREKIPMLLNEFMKTNNKKTHFSLSGEYLYIAIHLNKPFLECDKEEQVLNLENEIKFTENILLLMREIIRE